jgi:hypothetical protein
MGKDASTVQKLSMLTTPQGLMVAGRALALNQEKKFREEEGKKFGGPIDIDAENAKRGVTRESLLAIKRKNDARELRDLTNRIAADIPLRQLAPIQQIINDIGDKVSAKLKAEREDAAARLGDGLTSVRQTIPLSLREGVRDFFAPATNAAPSLKDLLRDSLSEVQDKEGELVKNKERGKITGEWLKSFMPDVLGALPGAGADALASLKVDFPAARKSRLRDGFSVQRGRFPALEANRIDMGPTVLQTLQSRTLTRGDGPIDHIVKNTAKQASETSALRKAAEENVKATKALVRKFDAKPKVVGTK